MSANDQRAAAVERAMKLQAGTVLAREVDRLRAELAETRAAGAAIAKRADWLFAEGAADWDGRHGETWSRLSRDVSAWRSLRAVPAPDRAGDDEPRTVPVVTAGPVVAGGDPRVNMQAGGYEPRLTAEHERMDEQVLRERDEAIEAADTLAGMVAPSTIVGEHSNSNEPWQNAMDYAGGPWGSHDARHGPWCMPPRRAGGGHPAGQDEPTAARTEPPPVAVAEARMREVLAGVARGEISVDDAVTGTIVQGDPAPAVDTAAPEPDHFIAAEGPDGHDAQVPIWMFDSGVQLDHAASVSAWIEGVAGDGDLSEGAAVAAVEADARKLLAAVAWHRRLAASRRPARSSQPPVAVDTAAPDPAVHDSRRPQLGDADLDMVLLSAIRYALGRATYIVGWTVDLIAAQAQWLAPGQRDVAIRDIVQALAEGRTGHEQDTAQWQRALNHLRAAGQPVRDSQLPAGSVSPDQDGDTPATARTDGGA